jgi:hypothetical protein
VQQWEATFAAGCYAEPMSTLRWVRACWWGVTFVLTGALHAQSLADVAKQTEERAKAKQEQTKSDDTTTTTKVYTNKDLRDHPGSFEIPVPVETESPKASGTIAEEIVTAPTATKDEDWWRSRALALRRTLADDTTKLVAAQKHYDSLPDQARGILGTPIVEAWMKAKEEISRLTGIVANDRRALADFEEEARRGNILPGWLRAK